MSTNGVLLREAMNSSAVADGLFHDKDVSIGSSRNAEAVQSGEVMWRFNTVDTPTVSASRLGDTVYIRDGESPSPIYALEASNGDVQWDYTYRRDAVLAYSEILDDSVIFVDRDSGIVVALHPETGEERWTFDAVDGPLLRVMDDDSNDRVILPSVGGNSIYSIDVEIGETEWVYDNIEGEISDVGIDDDRQILEVVSTEADTVQFIDVQTGAKRWEFTPQDGLTEGITWVHVEDDQILVADQSLYVLDTQTGENLARFAERADSVAAPTMIGDDIYVEIDEDKIVKYDFHTGSQLWQFNPTGNVSSSIRTRHIDQYEHFYVGTWGDGNALYAVEADTGAVSWHLETPGGVIGPNTWPDSIYFDVRESLDGPFYKYSVDHKSGEVNWVNKFEERIYLSSYEKNRVFLGTYEGVVYSINDRTGELEWSFDAPDHGDRLRPRVVGENLIVYPQGEGGSSVYGVEADILRQDTADSSSDSTQSFDPAVHGFGFSNHNITAEHGLGGILDTPRDVGEDVAQTLSEEISANDIVINEVYISAISSILVNLLNNLALVIGHCHGMVVTADQFYQNPSTVPADTAAAISDPATVHDRIDDNHRTQITEVNNLLSLLTMRWAPSQLSIGDELAETVNRIDEQGPTPIILYGDDIIAPHVCLAYEYGRSDGTTTLKIYDPNYPASRYNGRERTFTVDTSGETPTVTDPLQTVMSDSTVEELDILTPARVKPTNLQDVFDNLGTIMTFSLHSPAELEVIDPDGNRLEPPRQVSADFVYDIGAKPGEYDINVIGTDSGEYTLDIRAAHADGIVSNETQTGDIAPGETRSYTVSIPESVGQSSGTSSQASDFPSWVPYTGVGVGVLGGGALLYRYLRSDEDSTTDVSDINQQGNENEEPYGEKQAQPRERSAPNGEESVSGESDVNQQPSDTVYCIQCGATNSADSNYCMECGDPLT